MHVTHGKDNECVHGIPLEIRIKALCTYLHQIQRMQDPGSNQ
jgi:hypothetical protein